MYPRVIIKQIEPYRDSREAIVITGMRQTGKTTLMRSIYEDRAIENKIFLDLENPVNRKLFETDNYEGIKGSFQILGIDFTKRPFIFLDEIQLVKGLPSVIKRTVFGLVLFGLCFNASSNAS